MRKIQLILILLTVINISAFAQKKPDDKSLIKPYGDEAFNAIQEFFKYDKGITLDTKTIDVQDKGTYKLEKFVFTNSKKSLVPGYLAIPKSDKPNYPCMILLHAGAGSKDDWWSEEGLLRGLSFVNQLLTSGYAVMALDAEAHGERAINSDFVSIRKIWFEQKLVYKITDMWVQSTMDYRKAIDYLMARKEIDSTRIGIMGYSMGGAMTTYLCTQVPQIKVSVMCSVFLTVNEISPAIYPLHFIPRIPDIPVLLLEGNKDEIFHVSQAKEFERLLKSNKKKLILYDSGHFLPKEYLKDAFEWIRLYL
jgi:dienelactone hydrolase